MLSVANVSHALYQLSYGGLAKQSSTVDDRIETATCAYNAQGFGTWGF